MIKTISLNGRTVPYDLQRKRVKNINLRVRPDGSVTLSADPRVPEAVIEAFLQSQGERILRALDRCAEAAENAPTPLEYTDGEILSVFGRDRVLRVRQGAKSAVEDDGETLLVTVRDAGDAVLRRAAVQKQLDAICRETLTALCHQLFPPFAAQGVPFPTLRFRHMTSRWGSCQCQRGIVTFSYALLDKPLAFSEYVVVHELTHLLQPDHSKRFYDRVAAVLPDWRARRALGKRR